MSGRVLVIEEHALVALGVQLALSTRRWEVETTCGPTTREVVDHARTFRPQCAMLDTHVGNGLGSGIDLIGPLVATGVQVVMLTAERRRTVLAECLEAGAVGWIAKDTSIDEVDAGLGHVAAGGHLIGRTERVELLEELQRARASTMRTRAIFDRLTRREALVLGSLIDGLTAEEIADEHFVALTTVRSQIRAVLQKLGVRSQLAAVAVAGANRDLLPRFSQAGRERRMYGGLQRVAPGGVINAA